MSASTVEEELSARGSSSKRRPDSARGLSERSLHLVGVDIVCFFWILCWFGFSLHKGWEVQDSGVVSVMQVSFLENLRDIEMSASGHAFICPNNQIQETRPNNSFI